MKKECGFCQHETDCIGAEQKCERDTNEFLPIGKQERVYNALNELQRAMINSCSARTTSVKIFINCEGYHIEISERIPEGLKRDGISMRNIAGDFIK